ncbi:hypothetical protein HDU86_004773 [Geranomyces michiganensis]|nr:hypothetical protein HDU86_004773 [Geranomyces michiganensis]
MLQGDEEGIDAEIGKYEACDDYALLKKLKATLLWIEEFHADREAKKFTGFRITFRALPELDTYAVGIPARERYPQVELDDTLSISFQKRRFNAKILNLTNEDEIVVHIPREVKEELGWYGNTFQSDFVAFELQRYGYILQHHALEQLEVTFPALAAKLPAAFADWKNTGIPASVETITEADVNSKREELANVGLTLDKEQLRVVWSVVEGERGKSGDPYILVGPPGAGKMVTGTGVVVSYHRKEDGAVLIATPSNVTADSFVKHLAPYYPPGAMAQADIQYEDEVLEDTVRAWLPEFDLDED